MKDNIFNNNLIFRLSILIGLIGGIIIIFLTQNSYGGADATQHYNMAHWSWKHPELFFNHWGKPVFTILISPFAQLGMNAARCFNLFIGIITAILIWRIADKLNIQNARISIYLVLLTPIYFILIFTPLTEVLFSFFLVLSIYFFFNKKYYYSAIVLSFIPLIRNEGIVLFPLFIIAYTCKRKYLTILLLPLGSIFISLLGLLVYKDPFWLITQMPYTGEAVDIYGTGSLLHYINDTRGILGYPIGYLFIIGFIVLLFRWIKNDNLRIDKLFFIILLIPGSYITYVAAHSFVWWQGIGNSLGLIRVIGAVTPLAALTALLGLNLVTDLIATKNKIVATVFFYLLLIWIFALGLGTHRFGFILTKEQILAQEANDFIKSNDLASNKIYYFDPFVPYDLEIDPYDTDICQNGLPTTSNPSAVIPDSNIIVWDSHFGPNEFRINLNTLIDDPFLQLIAHFEPEFPIVTLGGHNYEVYIFMKNSLLNELPANEFAFDFEFGACSNSDISYSGDNSCFINKDISYKNFIDKKLISITDTITLVNISIEGWILSEDTLAKPVLLVCSLQQSDEITYYSTFDLSKIIHLENGWNKISHTFKHNGIKSLDETLKIYIWNKYQQDFYVDEIRIVVSG